MCGIAGKVSATEHVDRSLLEGMRAAIEHRGPDSRGAFHENGVGLGVQRLRVIDLVTGDQPIYNEDPSVVVVQNGEICNYRALRSELERLGHTFTTNTDTEVIVHLYENHGADCVRLLRAMFAFAVWDVASSWRAIGWARSRSSTRPKATRCGLPRRPGRSSRTPEVERTVDFDAIDCFLQLQYVPHPLSAFAAPRRLPPGHTLVWHDGEIRLARPVLEAFLPARRHRQPARGAGTNPLNVAGSDGAAVA